MSLYRYPIQTEVNRLIPKSKFYKEGQAENKIERLFIEQIEHIYWKNKLSSRTINLEESEDLKEIQIFQIHARVENIDNAIFQYIDKLILTPIIFEVIYQNRIQIVATYKRLNQTNKLKTVIGSYYRSQWFEENERSNLPLFLHLVDLYEHIISELLPINTDTLSSIEEKLALNKKLEHIHQEINQLKKKLKAEKQFNRKVEINLKLKELEKQLSHF